MNPYQNILLATDFSQHAEQTAARAQEIAAHYNASLHVLHVIEQIVVYNEDVDMVMGDPYLENETFFNLAKNRMEKFVQTVGFSKDVATEVQWGHPKTNIIDFANDKNIDLIIMGAYGHHGLGRLLGSVSSGVSHHAPCDTLFVRKHE